ncbi:reverse transcriptase domain-containing protein [Tanacetum coccineum]
MLLLLVTTVSIISTVSKEVYCWLIEVKTAREEDWKLAKLETTMLVTQNKKWADSLAADHLSRLENPDLGTFTEEEITDEFLDKHLMILKAEHCHSGPTEGHHSASITERELYESGFYWPSIFKDAKDYVMWCDACQRSGNISSRSEMPQNNIQWVKAQALPTNDARIVIRFLRKLFARFRVPKALISDRETHFCNSQLEKSLQKYGVTHKLSTAYHLQTNGQTEVTNRATYSGKIGKLKSKWYGPDVLKTVHPYGTVEIIDKNKISFKVNGQRLKKYHDGYNNEEEKEVIELDVDTT